MPKTHYQQAAKEAYYALGLTLFYVIAWCISAYLVPDNKGILGFPIWFELSCLYLPLLFSLLVAVVIRLYFKEIDLHEDKE
ncbi:YhdT family protein [Rodentibacter caecimuris]|uniref:DUF997 domain-containing protein n=1 Tax=Rodentibacter caecimuris TaxID=1796644 RepID=A0ABX3KZ13_9PAST|nr:hypothetical protein BKG89_03020 [Rodentibacter heylii]